MLMDTIKNIIEFVQTNWTTIFSGIGTTILIGILGYIFKKMKKNKKSEIDKNVSQSINAGNNSNIIQSADSVTIDNFNVKMKNDVQLKDAEATIIVQAGRDAILQVKKSPPNIKLVRVTVEDDHSEGGLKQKVNVIMKNNGDKSAFLLNGYVKVIGREDIVNPNHFGMKYSLSDADWAYDVDISSNKPTFVGKHVIAPNEVINFNVVIGRSHGWIEVTVYKCVLKFEFDESDDLECGPFFLFISGPTVFNAGFQACGPTPEEWGRAQVDNIRRLDKIGYDYRPQIHKDSRKYVEMIDPNIFKEKK